MDNAVWLFFALPQWYFITILAPLSGGPLTLIPAIGVVSLILGVALGTKARRRLILLFALLAFASQIFVAIAGFFRGSLEDSTVTPLLYAYLLIQVLAAAYLIYRIKGARASAVLLAIFTTSYAAFACFISAMSLTNDWL